VKASSKRALNVVAAVICVCCASQAALAQGYQNNQNGAAVSNNNSGNSVSTNPALLREWFGKYDMVRRLAQMSPAEKAKADDLMSHGLQMFVPGEEKIVAQKLLTELVGKYQTACNQLKNMPVYPETSVLHHDYFNYFSAAHDLFADYLRVQSNLMAKDANGQSIMAGLMNRKANLEGIEQQAKNVDGDVRQRLGIAPYRY
jgi:hypothetical protein